MEPPRKSWRRSSPNTALCAVCGWHANLRVSPLWNLKTLAMPMMLCDPWMGRELTVVVCGWSCPVARGDQTEEVPPDDPVGGGLEGEPGEGAVALCTTTTACPDAPGPLLQDASVGEAILVLQSADVAVVAGAKEDTGLEVTCKTGSRAPCGCLCGSASLLCSA